MADRQAAPPEVATGQLGALLAGIARQYAARPAQHPLDTLALLRRIAAGWPARLSGDDREALAQLARKLAVAKRVDTSYLPQWKRDAAAQELSPSDYLSLAIVLIAGATLRESDAVDERGFSLQLVNGALLARDRCDALAVGSASIVDAAIQSVIGQNFHA
jgi:hypothetical protein